MGKDKKMLTVSEVAGRLGESERTIRNWIGRDVFAGVVREETPRGPYWMIPEAALNRFEKPKTGRPRKSLQELKGKPRRKD